MSKHNYNYVLLYGGSWSNKYFILYSVYRSYRSAYNNYTRADFALTSTGFRIKLKRAV